MTVHDTAPVSRRDFLGGSMTMLAGARLSRAVGARPSLDNAGRMTSAPSDILIRDGFILTMDRRRTVYKRGSLYIRDGKIVQLGEKVDAPPNPDLVIEAEGKLVLPGFVNTHAHLQQYFRGTYELIGDFYNVNLPLEMYRSPDDMEALGAANCAEFIFGGVTTALVIYTYPDGFARAVDVIGNRAILAADVEEVDLNQLKTGTFLYLPEKGRAAFQRAVDLFDGWHGKAGGRITTCLCPKAPDMATAETYRKLKAFADERNLRITTHLAQTWREVQQVSKLYGKTPVEHLQDLGVLNDRLTGVHCDYITATDLKLIRDTGAGILHCRSVENPLLDWLDLGIPVGLGTDDYHHDMLPLLRQNITGQQTRARQVGGAEGMRAGSRLTRRPTFYNLLELATRKGAEAIGLGDQVGSLETGKQADVLTVDLGNPFLTPTKDPVTSFVLYGSSRDIDTVIVDGRILKHEGKLTTIDLENALVKAQYKVEEIIERFFREHPEQQKRWEQMAPHMV